MILDGEDFSSPIAGMAEYYAKLGRCPELLIAGINSKDRWHDYTPTSADIPDGTPLPTSGGAARFLKCITDEVLPFIEKEYRVTPFRILCGHSIGGLFVVNTLFEELSPFAAYIATSPSL